MLEDRNGDDVIATFNQLVDEANIRVERGTNKYDASHDVLEGHEWLEFDSHEKVFILEQLEDRVGLDHVYSIEEVDSAQTIFEMVDIAFYDAVQSAIADSLE